MEVGQHLREAERVAGGRGNPHDPALDARVLVERRARLRDLAEDRLGVSKRSAPAGVSSTPCGVRVSSVSPSSASSRRTCWDSAGWVT